MQIRHSVIHLNVSFNVLDSNAVTRPRSTHETELVQLFSKSLKFGEVDTNLILFLMID